MRHSKILDSKKVICGGCLNNDTLYKISEAIIINNKKEYYLYKIINKFTKWLFSKNKIKSQFVFTHLCSGIWGRVREMGLFDSYKNCIEYLKNLFFLSK